MINKVNMIPHKDHMLVLYSKLKSLILIACREISLWQEFIISVVYVHQGYISYIICCSMCGQYRVVGIGMLCVCARVCMCVCVCVCVWWPGTVGVYHFHFCSSPQIKPFRSHPSSCTIMITIIVKLTQCTCT